MKPRRYSQARLPRTTKDRDLTQAEQHKTAYAGGEACGDTFSKSKSSPTRVNSLMANTKRNTPLTFIALDGVSPRTLFWPLATRTAMRQKHRWYFNPNFLV